jgi:hypothetical protein
MIENVLMNTLGEQDFEPQRSAYLTKQLTAFETVCRRLNGESFSLNEEALRLTPMKPHRQPFVTLPRYDCRIKAAGALIPFM